MLVLTRKTDESIVLGKDIEIKILGIEEGKVKVGISAPKNIEIYRKEVYLTIEEENKAASKPQNLDQLKGLFKK
ncbi:carbon storage regulator CsrA [Alkaliphilus serpentinus]|uniref:Translational regulator CsrA n=1 Tax=Alkaliphilus serpentinus TaxID=1482731 RepID=A0A833HLS1_9FIRM|nr:carbon storage regulator CsrA [Alkaliphilus serpentinus]KAB3526642.1 carbon storage regulator CsrA [Alkaliphilus serpentinus]